MKERNVSRTEMARQKINEFETDLAPHDDASFAQCREGDGVILGIEKAIERGT